MIPQLKEAFSEEIQKRDILFRSAVTEDNLSMVLYESKLLLEKLKQTETQANFCMPYTSLSYCHNYLSQLIADYGRDGIEKIISADEASYEFCQHVSSDTTERIEDILYFYKDTSISLSALYGLKGAFENISKEKVWMKSGGYLYITPTEALTVIDVNTGKIQGKTKKEDTYLQTNLEAAREIAYQIGARNLSGIILVDFINMESEKNNTILIEKLRAEISVLSPPGNLVDVTKLGIAEITRQKKRADIYTCIKKMDKTILL